MSSISTTETSENIHLVIPFFLVLQHRSTEKIAHNQLSHQLPIISTIRARWPQPWLARGHSFVVNFGWLQRGGTLINVSLEKRSVLSSSTSNLIFGMKEDGIVVVYLAIAAAAGWQHFTFLTWQKLSCLDTSCSHDGIPSVHTVTNIFQNVTLFWQHFSSFWYPLDKVKVPTRALMKAVFSMLIMLLVN